MSASAPDSPAALVEERAPAVAAPRLARTRDGLLPGDLDEKALIERMIRVDHAGEYGAKRIYEGQLAVLGNRRCGPTIQRMADQERQHLQVFEKLVVERRVRPTALQPLWHVGGFALGAITALMGEKAAMACTVAVEETIDDHYARQAARLGDDQAPLREIVEQFRAEEIEHRDIGLAHGARETPGYPLLSLAIKTITGTAIWLSERI